MKASQIPTNEKPRHPSFKIPGKLGRAVRFLAEKTDSKTIKPETEPVDSETLAIAQFVHELTDPSRLNFLTLSALANDHKADRIYPSESVKERLHKDRYADDSYDRPQPTALLSLYGNKYRELNAHGNPNNFVCKIAVMNLEDGGRVIQVAPFVWEGPSGDFEIDGMRGALRELFGDEAASKELEEYARITLGELSPDGELTQTRPFRRDAFGVDFVTILDKVGLI